MINNKIYFISFIQNLFFTVKKLRAEKCIQKEEFFFYTKLFCV